MSVHNITSDTFEDQVINHKGVVFVDFYADWCGPCKMTSPIVEELSEDKKYESVKFVQVDVDANQDLAARFSIFSIPTFIIFNNGELVSQLSGYKDKAGFESDLQKAMS